MTDIPNLLERFRRGPELMAVTLTGVFGEEEDFTTAADKWTVRQIVAHVADTELVLAHRLRQIMAEDNPTLVAFNQEAWAHNLDYARRKPKQSLETFRRLRAENHELLKDAPESAWQRAGNHTQRGTTTLLHLVETYTDHAEKHARQIQAIREDYKQSKGRK